MTNVTYRHLQYDEIRSIGRIDNADIIEARYVCVSQADGLGLALHREAVNPPANQPNWGKQELATRYSLWEKNYRDEGAIFSGAFYGDDLVGMSAIVRLSDSQTCELYALHIDRTYRRQGIGSTLLDRAKAQGKAWSCNQLLTYTTFKASAVDFYLSKGFEIVGIQNPKVKTKNFDLTLLKRLI